MGYGFNFQSVGIPLDKGGSSLWQETDSDKLEPTDSDRKQVHLGGTETYLTLIAPSSTLVSASSDGAGSAFAASSYSDSQYTTPALIGLRGRGTSASPSGVQDGDLLFSFGASGVTPNGNPGFYFNQFAGMLIAVDGTPSGDTIPINVSLTTPEGTFIKTSTGRLVMLGSGSTSSTERLGIKSGRIELEETTSPSLRSGWGKLWASSSDSKLYYMDDSGTEYNLTIDDDAIHDNVASEISAITSKATPVSGDYLLIEDSEDSNNKKKITIGDLPSGGGTDSIVYAIALGGI